MLRLITAESVVGNINADENLRKKHKEMSDKGLTEVVKISRYESERVRMRKTSNKGTDVAFTLPSGTKLRHGDVIVDEEGRMIVVEIEPERVAVVEIKHDNRKDMLQVPVRIGHTIGNLHRPIKQEGNKVYFPIQSDSEIDMFNKLLSSVKDYIEISKTTMVFEPEEGMDVHEH